MRAIWVACFVTGYLGSQAWSLMLAKGFLKHLAKRRAARKGSSGAGKVSEAAAPPPGREAAAGGAARRKRKVRVE